MLRRNYKNYFNFSTICIIAGGPHQDLLASRFMKTLKQKDASVNFIGIGGPLMESEGLQKNYSDVKKFCHKPFFPYRNFLRWHVERSYHPAVAWIHYKNHQVIKDLDKSSFFQDIYNAKPAAFISFGNEFFMNRLFDHLSQCYYEVDLIKPPLFHFDRTHANQKHEFLTYLDHHFSVIPRMSVNYQNFQFPHTVVGIEGIGRAWQFLYQRTASKFKGLTDQNSIFLPACPIQTQGVVEKLVLEERGKFRSALGIQESSTVFFFAPGNLESEVLWTVPRFYAGWQEFIKRPDVKLIDKESFTIVVSVPAESDANSNNVAQFIETQMRKFNWGCRIEVTKDKYSAICGSDIGAVFNGEIVAECSALQLPLFTLDNMPFLQAYMNQWYNEWNNDLNIASLGETYQEVSATSATPYRISDELFYLYNDPKLRYYIAQKMTPIQLKMIPFAQDYQSQAIVDEGKTFNKHTFTLQTIVEKVFKAANSYETQDKNIPSHKISEVRGDFLKNSAGLQ